MFCRSEEYARVVERNGMAWWPKQKLAWRPKQKLWNKWMMIPLLFHLRIHNLVNTPWKRGGAGPSEKLMPTLQDLDPLKLLLVIRARRGSLEVLLGWVPTKSGAAFVICSCHSRIALVKWFSVGVLFFFCWVLNVNFGINRSSSSISADQHMLIATFLFIYRKCYLHYETIFRSSTNIHFIMNKIILSKTTFNSETPHHSPSFRPPRITFIYAALNPHPRAPIHVLPNIYAPPHWTVS